jgi:peptide/nickel transport system permease protein
VRRPGKKLLLPVACLATTYLVVLAAGFVAPYDYSQQNRDAILSPPTKVHWVDDEGAIHLRPFVYQRIERPDKLSDYQESITVRYSIRFLTLEYSSGNGASSAEHRHLFGVDQPAHLFLLGTDDLGRDVFTRLLYGGRISLLSGLFAAFLSLGLAIIFGTIAGYYGSWVDAGIMRVAELFLSLPWLYLLLALRAFLPLHIDPVHIFFIVIALIGLLGWPRPTRLIRGMALSLRERHYISAARSFGASDAYLIRRHILPEISGLLLTQAALLIPQYALAEVTLSFFGLGIGEPIPSWGSMLASLQQYRVLVSAWWMFSPGVVMAMVFFSCQAVHDALRADLRIAEL